MSRVLRQPQARPFGGGRYHGKTHPDTHFVPEHTATQTEEYVEYARDTKNTAKEKRHKPATVQEVEEEAEDGQSFKAADEKREKASTEFFEDTALMGLFAGDAEDSSLSTATMSAHKLHVPTAFNYHVEYVQLEALGAKLY
ncbi:hypothetical protein B0H14DRAFT_3424750 [Mycena olivaceomarginata]|nr:hypothetical protein B0H14DRAFT_3424750 [Mycena olivaceomarginata]